MSFHAKVFTFTRFLVAIMLLAALWCPNEVVSDVCATIGTLVWLFMSQVVRFEEYIINRIRK